MSIFAKGDTVRQIIPSIEGIVTGFQIDQETGERLILVEYKDNEGVTSGRYFKESEIEPS